MATRVQITFDCADPHRLAAFWEEALHYIEPSPPPPHETWQDWARAEGMAEEYWDALDAREDPDGAGPRLFFQRVPESKVAKNRVHLDLQVGGGAKVPLAERRAKVDAEVVRLKELGATDERGSTERGDEYWVRMNDPEGNEFCVE